MPRPALSAAATPSNGNTAHTTTTMNTINATTTTSSTTPATPQDTRTQKRRSARFQSGSGTPTDTDTSANIPAPTPVKMQQIPTDHAFTPKKHTLSLSPSGPGRVSPKRKRESTVAQEELQRLSERSSQLQPQPHSQSQNGSGDRILRVTTRAEKRRRLSMPEPPDAIATPTTPNGRKGEKRKLGGQVAGDHGDANGDGEREDGGEGEIGKEDVDGAPRRGRGRPRKKRRKSLGDVGSVTPILRRTSRHRSHSRSRSTHTRSCSLIVTASSSSPSGSLSKPKSKLEEGLFKQKQKQKLGRGAGSPFAKPSPVSTPSSSTVIPATPTPKLPPTSKPSTSTPTNALLTPAHKTRLSTSSIPTPTTSGTPQRRRSTRTRGRPSAASAGDDTSNYPPIDDPSDSPIPLSKSAPLRTSPPSSTSSLTSAPTLNSPVAPTAVPLPASTSTTASAATSGTTPEPRRVTRASLASGAGISLTTTNLVPVPPSPSVLSTAALSSPPVSPILAPSSPVSPIDLEMAPPALSLQRQTASVFPGRITRSRTARMLDAGTSLNGGAVSNTESPLNSSSPLDATGNLNTNASLRIDVDARKRAAGARERSPLAVLPPQSLAAMEHEGEEEEEQARGEQAGDVERGVKVKKKEKGKVPVSLRRSRRLSRLGPGSETPSASASSSVGRSSPAKPTPSSPLATPPDALSGDPSKPSTSNTSTSAAPSSPTPNQIASTSSIAPPSSQPSTQTAPSSTSTSTSSPPTNRNPLSLSPPTNRLSLNTFGYGYGHSAGYKSSPLSPTKPLVPGVSSPAAGGSGGDASAEASGSGAASTPAQGMPTGKAHTSSNTHTPTHTPPTSPTRSPRVIDAVDFGLPLLGVGANPAVPASGSVPSNASAGASGGPAVSGAAPASSAKGKEKEKEKEKEKDGEAREKEAAPASGGTLTEAGVPEGQPRPSRPKLSLEIDRGAEEGSQGAGVSSSPIAVSSSANPPVVVPVAILPVNAGESESTAGEVSGPEAEARVLSSSLLFSGGSESAQVQVQAQASASFDAGIPEVEKDSEREAEREREQDGQVQDLPVENRFEASLPSGQPLRQDEYAYVDRMDVDMSLSPAPSALQMQPVLESGSVMDERTMGNDQIPSSLAPPQEPLQQQQPQYYYQSPSPPPPPVIHPVYSPTWEEPPKLESEKNLWRLACKVRVWDMRRRYSLETIRALVLQEAHEYYAIHGFPPGYFGRGSNGSSSNASSSNSSPLSPNFDASSSMHPSDAEQSDNRSAMHMMPALSPLNPNRGVLISNNSEPGASSPLNFMEEPVYDWEIASSDDDEDYEGDEEGAVESVDEAGRKGKAKDLGGNDSPKSTSGNSASGVSEDEDEDEDEGEEERMVAQRKEKRKMLLEKKREAVLAQGRASSKSKGKGKAKMVEGEENASTTPTPQGVEHDNDEDDDDDLLDDLDDVDEAMLDIEMDLDDALHDPSFNFELSSPTSPTLNLMLGSSTSGNRSVMGSPSPTTPGPAPGVFNAFYVPPVSSPVHENNENSPPPISVPPMHPTDPTSSFLEGGYIDQQPDMNASAGPSSLADPMSPGSNAGSGLVLAVPPASPDSMVPPREHSHTPPAMRVPRMAPMIMELPPPKLSTVPVWLLRNTDMMVGGSMGKGTPVDRGRAAAWATASSSPRKSVSVESNGMAMNVGLEGGSVVGSTGSGSSIGSSDSNVNDGTRPVESPSENEREGESSSGVGGVREEGMHSLPGSGNVLSSAQLKEEQVESDKSFLTLSAPGNSVTDSSTGSGSTSSSSSRKDAQTAKVEEDVIVDPGFMPTADWDAFIASLTLSNSNTNGNSNGNAGMTPGGDTLGLSLSASPIERSPGVPPQPQSHMITAFHSHLPPSPSSTSFMSTFHNGFLGGQQAFMLNPGAMGTPNVNVASGNVPPPSPGSTTSLPSSSSSSPSSSPSTQQDNYGSLVNVHTPGTNGFQGHQPSSPTFGMNVNVGLFGGPGSVDGLNAMNTMFGMPIHPSNQAPSMGVNYNYNMGVGMGVNPMGMNMTMPIQIPTVQNLGIPSVGVPMSLGNAGNGNGTGTVPMSGMGMGLVPSFSSLNGLNTMNAMNMPGMNINPAMGAMGMGFTTGIGVGGMQLGVGLTLSLGPSPTHQHQHHQQQSNLLLASGSSNPTGASLATENANTNIASQDGPTSQNSTNGGNNNGSNATNSNTPSTLSFALG